MPKKPIIIGVTGGSGGGKTSVSRAILSNFPDEKIAMIEHDSKSVYQLTMTILLPLIQML